MLIQSDFFPPISPGILVIPGYCGLIYDMLYNGHIMDLQGSPSLTNKTEGTWAIQ